MYLTGPNTLDREISAADVHVVDGHAIAGGPRIPDEFQFRRMRESGFGDKALPRPHEFGAARFGQPLAKLGLSLGQRMMAQGLEGQPVRIDELSPGQVRNLRLVETGFSGAVWSREDMKDRRERRRH